MQCLEAHNYLGSGYRDCTEQNIYLVYIYGRREAQTQQCAQENGFCNNYRTCKSLMKQTTGLTKFIVSCHSCRNLREENVDKRVATNEEIFLLSIPRDFSFPATNIPKRQQH